MGWLAGHRRADRIGAFLLSFGIWDLTYYAVLRLIVGWPERLNSWDVLFLIPAPWVAPVWAPASVAMIFVLVGSYLFWTADRARWYRGVDLSILAASAGLTLAAFLAGSGSVIARRMPERFPQWLFWLGVGLGTGWFVVVERGHDRTPRPDRSTVGP